MTLAPAIPFTYYIPNRLYTVELPVKKIIIKYPIPPAWFNKDLLNYISKECKKNNVPVLLVHKLIEQESQWHSNSPSPNYDRHHNLLSIDYGLMQINSDNLERFAHAYKEPWRSEKSYNPMHNSWDNVHFGICYLRDLYLQFGNWKDAVAAYNGGTKRVKNNTLKKSTQEYVNTVCPVTDWWLTLPTNYVSPTTQIN
jgi:soluble lytic murein transglycosylase-like protein